MVCVEAFTGAVRSQEIGYERNPSSPSKTLRAEMGRQICPAGCGGRAQKHRLEKQRQRRAAPRKRKRKTRRVEHVGRRTDWSPTGPRKARPDDRLRRNPPSPIRGGLHLPPSLLSCGGQVG